MGEFGHDFPTVREHMQVLGERHRLQRARWIVANDMAWKYMLSMPPEQRLDLTEGQRKRIVTDFMADLSRS